jgi:hypothetical protein
MTTNKHDRQEGQLVTAVWRNGGFSASYDSFVVGSSAVLRMNICAKIRHYAKPQNVLAKFKIDSKRAGWQENPFPLFDNSLPLTA